MADPGTGMETEQVVLGRVSGLYGVRGWVKIYSYTEARESILDYSEWRIGNTDYSVDQGKIHGKGVIAKLEGIEDRDQAAGLIGQDISVPRSALPQPEEDQFYWSDLQGCQVTTRQGDDLGKVDYLFATGANDVMVVKGERERLLPFIDSVILTVDLTERLVVVEWDKDF
jgi:16S rRNA processing protein RimM